MVRVDGSDLSAADGVVTFANDGFELVVLLAD